MDAAVALARDLGDLVAPLAALANRRVKWSVVPRAEAGDPVLLSEALVLLEEVA